MGAEQFVTRSKGKTADEAFRNAVSNAQYEHGHGGYTGTIAEKSSFKMVTPRDDEGPMECVDRCMDDENHFSDDKWGPAGCVKISEGVYCFFGWASS